MTSTLPQTAPVTVSPLPVIADTPRPPQNEHQVIDLALLCAEISAVIDPEERMRLGYGDTLMMSDQDALSRTLGAVLSYLRGRGFLWVNIEADQTMPDWIGLTLDGDVGPNGRAPSPLNPCDAGLRMHDIGLADLNAPETGLLSMRQRKGGMTVTVHLPGRTLPDADLLEAEINPDGQHYAVG